MTIYNIAKSNEERKTNNSKIEVLQKENQDMKESIATFSQEKNSSLSAQTECYSKKHEEILAKLHRKYSNRLSESFSEKEKLSAEKENLKKRLSRMEKEINFLKDENKILKGLPTVRSSVKGVQLDPLDLCTNKDRLPNLLLDKLNKLREAGGYQPVYSPSKYAPDNT